VRTLNGAEQCRIMAFAQMTFRESLRDVEACLSARSAKLYSMGLRRPVIRSTLADANESRDWRIHADLAQRLIVQARKRFAGDAFGIDLDETVYTLDSTTIDLCLSTFPRPPFRTTKAAIELHTLLDLRGSIPAFIRITDGKVRDVNVLGLLPAEPGAIYVMDRGCVDVERLFALQYIGAYFVTRGKANLRCRRIYSMPVDRSTGLICDQHVELTIFNSRRGYPERMRRIRFNDPGSDLRLTFLTNHFGIPAMSVCALYKNRWQVELFFRWTKQNPRIKRFYVTSENAAKSQIWIAVSVYVLVVMVRKGLHLEASLQTLLQILSVTVFENCRWNRHLRQATVRQEGVEMSKQLNLFGK
jgi:hypothetical protein